MAAGHGRRRRTQMNGAWSMVGIARVAMEHTSVLLVGD